MMLERIEARGRDACVRAVRGVVAQVEAAAREGFPELDVTAGEDEVVLSGPGLVRRTMTDVRLRWIAGLIR